MAKIALLIGVSEYEPGLEKLPSAVNDVTAMQQVLTNPNMGEFADADVTVLPNPSRQAMEDAIYHLFANRAREDLVLLYFSGHGVVDEGGEFYFASRFTRKDQGRLVPTTAVASQPVRKWMQDSRSQRKVIILDSCFSSAFARGVTVKDSGSVNPEQFLGGKGTAILTASTRYAETREDFDLSVYTHYLVEGIRTGGADQDDDGLIAIEELHTYASSKVKEAAPAMTPEFYGVKDGDKILLAKSPKDDPQLKYRKEVEKRAHQGMFSIPVRRLLEARCSELGLSLEEAERIESEVLQPHREHQRKLKEYEETLLEAIQDTPQLSERVLSDFSDYQQYLGLKDVDIQPIQERVMGFLLNYSVSAPKSTEAERSNDLRAETARQPILFESFSEHCTGQTTKALHLSKEETRRLGHVFAGSEQILLGLIGEGTGIAAKVLKSQGVNLKFARIEVEKIIGRGSGFVAAEIPFTPRAKQVLERSVQEANRLEHKHVGTGHLLLGLLRGGDGVGLQVLENLDVNLQSIVNLVLRMLDELENK